jgi:hypothetical protein
MSLYVAVKTAFVDLADGVRVKVIKNVTVAREGHEILKRAEGLFERLHVHFDVEKPPPAPPKKTAPPAPPKPAPDPEPEKS